jgi:lipoprotein-releasing system permease protein
MGFSLELALRYMGSRRRSFISMGTFFAVLGVALGVAGLATAMSVTGGFQRQFRDKVLGVNAHVIVLKRSSYFGEYREIMAKLRAVPGVVGVAPFTINPMMVTRGGRTATGVLLKGVEPGLVAEVLDLPRHLTVGSLDGLRVPGAQPPASRAERQSRERQGVLAVIAGDAGEPEAADDGAGGAQTGGNSGARGDAPSVLDGTGLTDELRALLGAEVRASRAASPSDEGTAPLPEGAPVGAIEPEGGYGSRLPEDDVLDAVLDPDPCAGDTQRLPGIVIGKTLGQNLRAGLGDCVQVTSPTIGFSFSRDSIRAPVAKQFRVTGIFDAGFDQYDAKLVYTDLYQAQQFYDAGDSVTGVELKVRDIEQARAIARRIDGLLGGGLHYTMDWEELNHGLFTALRIQQVMMSLVLALIIVVAAFTVIATLIMVVLDKRKEIAVMKAMGATDAAILRAFLYQGGIIGLLGALLGLLLGLGVCKGLLAYALPLDPKVYFISRLPVDVRPVEFAAVGVFAVLVCVVATAWPAVHAARLRPAEAFREQ